MRYTTLLFAMILSGCGYMEFSPWQSNPPAHDMNVKALEKIQALEANKPQLNAKFALIGDTQVSIDALKNVMKVIKYDMPDIEFVLVAGDVTDAGLRREFEWISDIFKDAPVPVLAVPGNHDGLNNGKKLFREVFGPLNSTFNFRGLNFVLWNNNGYEWNVDVDWLDDQLQSTAPSIVVSHQPPYSDSLSDTEEERWHDLRHERPVIASLHAHVHHWDFRRETPNKPIFVVNRIQGDNFGVVTVTDGTPQFQRCTPACSEVEP